MSRWLRWLDEIGAGDHGLVGGKAGNLGVLTRIADVPPAVCITVHAFADALGSERRSRVCSALDALGADPDPDELGDTCAAIESEIEGLDLDEALLAELRAALVRLDGPVAVRSSATAEDLPNASFAGQQDTILNVVGFEALIPAIKRCWASLYCERAVAYRSYKQIPHQGVAMGVAVQRMVAADFAGVAFTAHPVSGDRSIILIEAIAGLGEALVAGNVRPDRYALTKSGLHPVAVELGDQAIAIHGAAAGGVAEVKLSGGRSRCLDDAGLHALGSVCLAIEAAFGSPQDIEWASERGRLWLLQSRPITTLG